MYSRSTDRGGRRIKLPPGYDGNAFRHDTGEVRRLGGETEMKIHSPSASLERTETVEEHVHDGILSGSVWERRSGSSRKTLSGEWREIPERGYNTGEPAGDAEPEGERKTAEEEKRDPADSVPAERSGLGDRAVVPAEKGNGSLLEGLLSSLGNEDWLLILVILLLLADGSDAWDLILLLGVLLAVK